MKKIISIYVIYLKAVIGLFATDGFAWQGTLSDFDFPAVNSIQLNANSAGKSYLVTQSERCLNTQWEFDALLSFNPSSSNYMDVYLSCDNDSLTGDLNGYFVRIGYTNDNICLYRKEGSKISRVIEGEKKRLDYSSVSLNVKVICSSEAEWVVYSKLNEENEFTEEGRCTDFFHFDRNFFGFLCVYTTTRSNGFRFGNLTVSTLNKNDEGYLDKLEKPEANDVVFNEITFNGTEYVEFYNRSSKTIDTSQLHFTIRRSNGNFSAKCPLSAFPKPMYPESFIVLTKYKETLCSRFFCNGIEITVHEKMPQLSNTGADLVLMDTNDELIDEMIYSDKMHQTLIMNKVNIALERINPHSETNDITNWQTASFDSGYGTPGKINSQYLASESSIKIDLTSDVFQPCGNEEKLFEYTTQEPGANVLVLLFDRQGRIVKTVANNVLSGTSGSFFWDGLSDDKSVCESGIYVLYMEIIGLNGRITKTKKAFTLSKC